MLRELASFSLDPNEVAERLRGFRAQTDDPYAYADLLESVTPARVKLLKSLNGLPSGFQFLVNLRSDLTHFREDHPELAKLDVDLRRLLKMWFDVDLLSFERITWDSPASLLEKLIDYENVHQIESWVDLKNRLKRDRRCYALMHPKMPEEPLIFVEIALTKGFPDTIDNLLDEEQPVLEASDTDTAVFYSISNTQPGLRGISFGNFLLERVIEDLEQQLPNLERYVTLSPVPGFRKWLIERLEEQPQWVVSNLRGDERDNLEGTEGSASGRLEEILGRPEPESLEQIRDSLIDMVAHYLLDVRRDDGLPVDPVARFHLRNGARLERINWMGNGDSKGLENALGIMVNYRYSLDHLIDNHRKLMEEQIVPAHGDPRRRADRISPA